MKSGLIFSRFSFIFSIGVVFFDLSTFCYQKKVSNHVVDEYNVHNSIRNVQNVMNINDFNVTNFFLSK